VGFVVFILVVSVIGYLLIPPSLAINVTEIEFQSSDTVCGLGNYYWDGFSANESQIEWILLSVSGNSTGSCTISTVSSATSGFSVSGASVPLTISANGSATLQFNVTCPSSAYNGILTLSAT
jgi:hypothetical protein